MGPQVMVQQVSQVAGSSPHLWVVTWKVQNTGDQPLNILNAQCPHGRFRATKVELADFPELMPGKSASLELSVTCKELPGTVVENTFLILQARWRDQHWQILTRLTMTIDQRGAPNGFTEVITTQPEGFSKRMGDSKGALD